MQARKHLAIVHRQVASILSDKILLKSLSPFSDKWSPKGIACVAIVVKARESLSDCSSPSRQHKLSDKILPKSLSLFLGMGDRQIAIACLAIGCRKIASEDLAIWHSQIASEYLASFDCQITIAYLAIIERKIAESI